MSVFLALLSFLVQQPIPPNLAQALNNPVLREASFALPDGTIMIDPKKPKTPNLTAALQNPYLKSASYTLSDGTIIIDPWKPVSPNLSEALHNSALRHATFNLPDGVRDPNLPLPPNLAKVSHGLRLFETLSLYFHITCYFCVHVVCNSCLPSHPYIRTFVEGNRDKDFK